MRIAVLVEPIENGRFRAHAGEPFSMSEDGATGKEATDALTSKIQERVSAGATISIVDIPNGRLDSGEALGYAPDAIDDWFFQELQKEILENRRLEDEAEANRWDSQESRS